MTQQPKPWNGFLYLLIGVAGGLLVVFTLMPMVNLTEWPGDMFLHHEFGRVQLPAQVWGKPLGVLLVMSGGVLMLRWVAGGLTLILAGLVLAFVVTMADVAGRNPFFLLLLSTADVEFDRPFRLTSAAK